LVFGEVGRERGACVFVGVDEGGGPGIDISESKDRGWVKLHITEVRKSW